jgi:hypothetical protein
MPRFAAGLSTTAARTRLAIQPGLQTCRTWSSARCRAWPMRPSDCVCAGRTDAGVHARAGGPFRQHRRSQRAWLASRRQHLSTARRERRRVREVPSSSTRASARPRAATVTSSSIAIRGRPSRRAGRPGNGVRSMPHACTLPRRRWSANMTSARSARWSASPNPRCGAWSISRSCAARSGSRSPSPPMPSCITWCVTSRAC